MILGLPAALIAAVLYGVASILQATGSRRAAAPDDSVDSGLIGRLLRQPAYLAALGVTLLGFAFHLYAVRQLPLFLAQVGIAVSLVVTALLAVRIFGDTLNKPEWAAIAGVVVGLFILSASAGDTGTKRGSGWLTASLFIALAVMAVVGFIATRFEGVVATAVLGLLGGCGYAIVGISSRLLPDFTIVDLVTSPVTYSLGLGGLFAFLLYSLALQRGAVTAATTPLIATQTIVPSVVGVAFLGDQVRDGWWPAAIVGFLITAASAIVLVRFEGVDDSRPDPASTSASAPASAADADQSSI